MDNKKIGFIAIGLIALVGIGYYHILLKNDLSELISLRTKKQSLQDTITRNRNMLQTLKIKSENIKHLEQEIDEYKLIFIEGDRVPFFLNYVSALAKRNSIIIKTIEPGRSESGELFSRTVFNAEIRGRFPHIYEFMYHLEDNWKALKIESFSIDRDSNDSHVNVKLTLTVLSLRESTEKV